MLRKNIDKAMLLETYRKKACNISLTCKEIGISRPTFYSILDKDPEFKQVLSDVNEGFIDLVESKLLENITKNDTTSIIFFLKTKGRKRGYVEPNRFGKGGDDYLDGNAFDSGTSTESLRIKTEIAESKSIINVCDKTESLLELIAEGKAMLKSE